jgi:DNA-binding LytR/AlgR family response regulator
VNVSDPLINLRQVLRFDREDGGFIVMDDGSKVPLSRRRKAAFLERITS